MSLSYVSNILMCVYNIYVYIIIIIIIIIIIYIYIYIYIQTSWADNPSNFVVIITSVGPSAIGSTVTAKPCSQSVCSYLIIIIMIIIIIII